MSWKPTYIDEFADTPGSVEAMARQRAQEKVIWVAGARDILSDAGYALSWDPKELERFIEYHWKERYGD